MLADYLNKKLLAYILLGDIDRVEVDGFGSIDVNYKNIILFYIDYEDDNFEITLFPVDGVDERIFIYSSLESAFSLMEEFIEGEFKDFGPGRFEEFLKCE